MPEIVSYWDPKRVEYRVGAVVARPRKGKNKGKIIVRALHVGRRVVCSAENVEILDVRLEPRLRTLGIIL